MLIDSHEEALEVVAKAVRVLPEPLSTHLDYAREFLRTYEPEDEEEKPTPISRAMADVEECAQEASAAMSDLRAMTRQLRKDGAVFDEHHPLFSEIEALASEAKMTVGDLRRAVRDLRSEARRAA